MPDSIIFLVTGIVFGLTAGVSPGPLLTLVISETLKHGRKEGMKVALAPAITDLPIILITLYILSKLTNFDSILGVISILGGLFLGFLAYESLGHRGLDTNAQKIKPQSIQKAVIANFLSPAPYMFWFTIGAPTVLKAYAGSLTAAVLFVAGFYVSIIGAKIIVAVLVDKSKSLMKSRVYLYAIRVLGLIMLLFAVIFIKEGLQYFGVK
jgi:threonine/homoserine/homoserine lactone efflux protein